MDPGGCPRPRRSHWPYQRATSAVWGGRVWRRGKGLHSSNRRVRDPFARWCGREGPRGSFLSRLGIWIVTEQFISIFRQLETPTARGKYLSRVFGIFSEEIVRLWASDSRAPYEDLGRPTLRRVGEKKGSTLDFSLRSRTMGKVYAAELKCEIEYQDYRYFVLDESAQLDHHNKAAFHALLAAAAKDPDQRAYVGKKEVRIDGAILIWGAAMSAGRAAVINDKRFFDVLTLAEIIADLRAWGCEPYQVLLEQRRAWSNDLFDALLPVVTNTDA